MNKLDIKEVVKLYVEECWSTTRIAKQFGHDAELVRKLLIQFGIPRRNKSQAAKTRYQTSGEKETTKTKMRAAWTPERRSNQAEVARRTIEIRKSAAYSAEEREQRRQRMIVLNRNSDIRKQHAETKKAQWADPTSVYNSAEYWKEFKRGTQHCPNRLEVEFLTCASALIPKLCFVGDFSMMVGSKNPDFWVKDSIVCIDLFGDYWHRNQDPRDRIIYFAARGYDLIVLWESTWKERLDSTAQYVIQEIAGQGSQMEAVRAIDLTASEDGRKTGLDDNE